MLLFAIKGNGQNNNFDPYSSWGVKQGINYSYVLFSPSIPQNLNFNYTGGLVYKYQNQKRAGLQLELNYSQKGWVENIDTVGDSYSRKLDYIELPIMTHIVLGKRNLKYYANLGMTFSYLLSEKEKLSIKINENRKEFYEKAVDHKFDYSILGEAGIVFDTKIGAFQSGVRFQWTLTDLFKSTSETIIKQSQNCVLSFSVCYFFGNTK